jgi:hypothetical protein
LVQVGGRAQHQAGDRRVEAGVLGGQGLGGAVDHPDQCWRPIGGGACQAAQVGFWLHRQDLGDRGRVVREVQAVTRTDLDDAAGQAGEQPAAMLGHLGVHQAADPRVQAGEEGVVNRLRGADHQAERRHGPGPGVAEPQRDPDPGEHGGEAGLRAEADGQAHGQQQRRGAEHAGGVGEGAAGGQGGWGHGQGAEAVDDAPARSSAIRRAAPRLPNRVNWASRPGMSQLT